MRGLLLLPLIAVLVPGVNAQRMISSTPRFSPHHMGGGHARPFFYPLAFSDFYSEGAGPWQPSVIVLPSPPAVASTPEPSRPPAQPLMIELQGDRYVQTSGEGSSSEPMIATVPKLEVRPKQSSGASASREFPAVVLVFHDGHREQISNYTIADGSLYAHENYYIGGTWNRKIALSALNLPETLAANQSRGVPFLLPKAPNEVVLGP